MNAGILLWLQQLRTPALNQIMLGVTNLVWLVPASAIAGLCVKRYRKLCIQILMSVLAAWLLTDLIKMVVQEPRPFVTVEDLTRIGPVPGGSSFPSAHTAVAFSLFWTLWLSKSPAKWWGLAFGILIAFSRMYLGVHYPLDVAAGIITSWAACYGVHKIWKGINYDK